MTDTALHLEIDIEEGALNEGCWDESCAPIIRRAIEVALKEINAKPQMAELSILLTNDAHQTKLNTQWRNKSSSTNVLSFPQIEPFAPLEGLLGDISVAYETLVREAEAQGVEFDHHLTHLVVHGFLHIVGFDHETDEDAEQMETMERQILARMGIDDPYKDAQNSTSSNKGLHSNG